MGLLKSIAALECEISYPSLYNCLCFCFCAFAAYINCIRLRDVMMYNPMRDIIFLENQQETLTVRQTMPMCLNKP